MIEAVTYGMIPSAKSENRESADAREEVEQPRTVLPPAVREVVLDRSESTPGAGIHGPRR
jgi:hypothetical protein